MPQVIERHLKIARCSKNAPTLATTVIAPKVHVYRGLAKLRRAGDDYRGAGVDTALQQVLLPSWRPYLELSAELALCWLYMLRNIDRVESDIDAVIVVGPESRR